MPKVRQPSRKTKSAWRKNIDLEDVEASLENARAAERLGLAPITSTTHSSALFVEDRKGDEEVKKKLRAGKKPLKSLSILREKEEGSMAVIGRARRGVADALAKKGKIDKETLQNGLTPEQRALRNGMSKKDIEKLRRMTGRDVKGAFGALVEEEEEEAKGKQSGPQAIIGEENYDVWTVQNTSSSVAVEDHTQRSKPRKAPRTLLEVRTKDVTLPLPKPGQSYNPTAEEHEALLEKALQKAQSEEDARRLEAEYKQMWDQGARAHAMSAKDEVARLLGMQVSSLEEDEAEDADERIEELEGVATAKKPAKRKTKQQRTKAKKLNEEIRAREKVKASKRTRAQLQQLRILHKQLAELDEEQTLKAAQREEARKRRSEEKVGMYKLPKPEEEVQLGEDLSESLRGLKPEGNLLRDRIHAFQKRGLIEPKKQNVMKNNAKGLTRRRKEYERHSYKRFT